MLFLNLLVGALSGPLLGLFRIDDRPPLLGAPVPMAAFFCAIALLNARSRGLLWIVKDSSF
jgi:hypothetical protein